MNQPRSIFEATQRFIMKHFVSQRCGSRPQNGIPTKILYHLSLPCQLSTPLLDFITFFQFQMHFTSLSNPYCLLFNMTWSPWVHDGRPLRPQWRIVGAMQIATRALWPWAPFNWDKARTVTWYVSGKVMKVTGFDIFTWNLAMTSDLLKVNQGRNSKQNSVIGGERCCHVFWNQTCSQHSTHSSWSISRHHFLDVLLEIRNESTHFNLSQIVPFINLQEKRAKNCQCTWKTFYTQTYFSCDKTCVLQYMLPVRHPCPFHVATLPGTLLSCWFRAYHRCWNRSFVGNRSSTTKLPRASQQRFAPSVLDFSPWVVGSNFAEQE